MRLSGSLRLMGHATDQQVVQELVRKCDKDGNDEADNIADIGTSLHGEDVMHFADIFDTRHRWYGSFIHNVHKHIIENYLIHRSLCDKYDKDIKETAGVATNFFPLRQHLWGSVQESCRLVTTASIRMFHNFFVKTPSAGQVEEFFTNLRVTPCARGVQGTTWLELYIMFRAAGYGKPIPDDKDKARSRATVAQQLKAFKRIARGVVERIFVGSPAKALFKPSDTKCEPLGAFHIVGNHPMVSFRVAADKAIKKTTVENLIKLAHKPKLKDFEKILNGESVLRKVKLKLNGRVGWDSRIQGPQSSCSDSIDVLTTPVQAHVTQCDKVNAFFQCPGCKLGGKEPCTATNFQRVDMDKKVKCTACFNTSPVYKWKCSCGIEWHRCPVHRDRPDRFRDISLTGKRPRESAATATPASGSTARKFDWEKAIRNLDSPKQKKARHERVLILGDAAPRRPLALSCLSPALRERFQYLFQ